MSLHSCLQSTCFPSSHSLLGGPSSVAYRTKSERNPDENCGKNKNTKKPVAVTFCSLSPQHTPVTMDQCVGDLCSDHHGDGSLPPKAPWRGWRVGGGGRGGGGGPQQRTRLPTELQPKRKSQTGKSDKMLQKRDLLPVTIRAVSKLNARQKRATDTAAIKKEAGKTFHSLTFKRAKNRTKRRRFASKELRTSV